LKEKIADNAISSFLLNTHVQCPNEEKLMIFLLFFKGLPGAMTEMAGLVSEQKSDVNRVINIILRIWYKQLKELWFVS
jgi:hypothetical protein